MRENSANSEVEEAATEIRAMVEAYGEERERSEADARDWAESEIREEAERKMAESGANTKTETEASGRARSWAEAKSEAKEKEYITRVAGKAR